MFVDNFARRDMIAKKDVSFHVDVAAPSDSDTLLHKLRNILIILERRNEKAHSHPYDTPPHPSIQSGPVGVGEQYQQHHA